ncbi:MAG: protein kinase domain-containing protein, partial [bacterium]
GVAAAHARGVAHRDLKPSNVLVDTQGVPKVLDFGIAVELGSTEDRSGQTTTFAGTPSWAAPEQVSGPSTRIDARADVHALGLLLAATLSGRAPFDASLGMEALFTAIVRTAVAPPSRARKSVPRELDLVVAHATEKEPERRYPTAAAFADDLARWRRGEPVMAHPPRLSYTLRKLVRRHPLATGSALVATALLTLTSVVAVRAAVLERDAREAAVNSEAAARSERDRAERMNDYFRALLAEVREKEDSSGATTARDLLAIASDRLAREPLGDEARRDLHETLLDAYVALGDYRAAIAEANDALALVTSDDDRSRGRILAALGSAQNRVGAGADARVSLEAALRSFDRHDARQMGEPIAATDRISALINLGDVHRKAARIDLALEVVESARRWIPARSNAERLAVLSFEAFLRSQLGDDAAALTSARALIAEFEPHIAEDPLAYASLLHNAGTIANNLDFYDESLRYLTRAIALRIEHREAAAPIMNTRVLVSAALSGKGDVDAAIANLEACGEQSGAPGRLRNRGIAGLYLRRNAEGDLARAREAAIDGAGHFLGPDSHAGLLAAATLQLLGKVAVREAMEPGSNFSSDASAPVVRATLFRAIEESVETLLARGADPLLRPYILGEIAMSALNLAETTEDERWQSIARSVHDGVDAMRVAGRGDSSECLLAELLALQLQNRLRRSDGRPEEVATAGVPGEGEATNTLDSERHADLARLATLERRAIELLGERSTTVRRIAAERQTRETSSGHIERQSKVRTP